MGMKAGNRVAGCHTRKASASARGARNVRAVTVRASSNPVEGQKFDYIIVGGGTAGCVLANRLSADESKSVLLIEAGVEKKNNEVKIPAGLTKLFNHPVFDWGLYSGVQKQLLDHTREVYLARGKLLGGSSCTNATLYFRGSAEDYNDWNLDGWKANDVLPWFVSAEDNADFAQSKYHGVGGAMHVETPRYHNKLHDEFFKAAAAYGLAPNKDFNDWSHAQAGYGDFQVTQQRGRRADMGRQYLQPALKRGNLKVLTTSTTTKLQFEKTRAKGVEFAVGGAGGSRHTAEVKPGGEVLLCTGTIHTPHLLQLSGVGPSRQLRDLGLPVVADLPGVGQNLQDHPAVLSAFRAKEEFKGISITSEIYNKKNKVRLSVLANYFIRGRGPLATTGCDRGAFLSTTGSGQPDLQIRFVPGMALENDGLKSYTTFANLYEKQGLPYPDGITFQLLACRAKSTGSVGLKSDNPFAQPDININYLSDPEGADLATLRSALRISRAIAAEQPLAEYLEEERFPGASISDDAAIDDYIRASVHSGNALVGTCKMGLSPEEGAVVSPADLSVYGVEGLRIVDASVIPRIPGGQTGAPVVMIAERIAAMLATQGTSKPAPSISAVPSPVAA